MKGACAAARIAAVLLVLTGICAPIQAETDPLPVGTSAPDFSLLDLNGKPLTLESLRGKAVVLNFWAFWCNTWEQEMPQLKDLTGRQEDLGFRLVAVSVDGTRLREFVRHTEGGIPFPVLLDIGGRVTTEYQVQHVPTVLILDSQGKVRYTYISWPGNQVILNHLRKLSAATSAMPEPSKPAVTRKPSAKRNRPQRRRK